MIAERIQQLMNSAGMNANELARELNVQRSAISHILSGRNKPGLDMLEKICRLFPGINHYWLITGEGKMAKPVVTPKPDGASGQSPTETPAGQPRKKEAEALQAALFYDDGTFRLFTNVTGLQKP